MKNKVVITGIGLVSSHGTSIEDFRQEASPQDNLKVQYKKDWSLEDVGNQYFYKIPDYDIKEYFDNLTAPYPLHYSQLAMLGCLDAMRDAQLEKGSFDSSRTGIMIDTAFGTSEAVEDYLLKLFSDGPRKVRPFKFSQTVSNVCLGYTARQFQLRGPSSLLFAESSLCYGYDLVQNGEADIMICGGVDSIRDYVFGLYHNEDALVECQDEERPAADSYRRDLERQADKNRITVGEASAFIILETLEHAQARNATIYAELVDYAAIQDRAYDTLIFERNADDCANSIEKALERSAVTADQVDAVIGAASCPWMFEQIELAAINKVWGDHPLYYTSVKPHIGETFSSSAQASVALAAQLLKDQKGKENPLKNFYKAPENIALDTRENRQYETAVVHTGQLGGNNTTFVLKAV